MRQIEIHLKQSDSELVERVVKAFEPVDWSVFPVEQQDRVLIRVVMHAGRSQKLIDTVQEALRDCSGWRITVLHIEATLPQPDRTPGPGAVSAHSRRSGRASNAGSARSPTTSVAQ